MKAKKDARCRVDGEEQRNTLLDELGVEGVVGNTAASGEKSASKGGKRKEQDKRLHDRVQVLSVERDDLVHVFGKVDDQRQPRNKVRKNDLFSLRQLLLNLLLAGVVGVPNSGGVAFEGGAGAVGNEGNGVFRCDFHEADDVFSRSRVDDGTRKSGRTVGGCNRGVSTSREVGKEGTTHPSRSNREQRENRGLERSRPRAKTP
jgi:hypothetical protein